jgi:hypothetical protein
LLNKNITEAKYPLTNMNNSIAKKIGYYYGLETLKDNEDNENKEPKSKLISSHTKFRKVKDTK